MWHEGSVDSVEIVKKWKSDPSSMGCKQCESSMHTCKHSDLFDAYWLLSKNKLLRKINPPTQFVEKDQIAKESTIPIDKVISVWSTKSNTEWSNDYTNHYRWINVRDSVLKDVYINKARALQNKEIKKGICGCSLSWYIFLSSFYYLYALF